MISDAGKTPTALSIRRVAVEEPTAWLEAGWRDLWRAPAASLAYGLVFAAIGWGLAFGLSAAGLSSLMLPLAGGFVLVAPLAAVGLYEISRRLELGEPAGLGDALAAWRRNGEQIGLMGVALLLTLFAWIVVALVLFAIFFRGAPPSLAAFAAQLVMSADNIPFLIIGTVVGGALAAFAFAISAVSLPMLMDRDVTVVEAMAASLAAVRRNATVMIGWAATLAVLAGLGLATFFVGLIVTLPLAGHASWHAYRALIRD